MTGVGHSLIHKWRALPCSPQDSTGSGVTVRRHHREGFEMAQSMRPRPPRCGRRSSPGRGGCASTRCARPAPGPGQVRLRLEGCGVCASNLTPWAGPDWMQLPDRAGRPRARGLGHGRRARRRRRGAARRRARRGALLQGLCRIRRRRRRGRGAPARRARRQAVPGRAARLRHEHLSPQRHRGRADGRDRRHRLSRRDPDAARDRRRRAGDRRLAPSLLARCRARLRRRRDHPDGRPRRGHRRGSRS